MTIDMLIVLPIFFDYLEIWLNVAGLHVRKVFMQPLKLKIPL